MAGPAPRIAAPVRDRARDAAVHGAATAAAPDRLLRMQFELDRAGGRADQHFAPGALPARHDVGLGEAPAIAMAGRHQRPARPRRGDECGGRGRATAMVRHQQHVHAPGIVLPRAARPRAPRSTSPVSSTACGPARTRSTQERSLSFGSSVRARVQPLESHAVPGPAHCRARSARPARARPGRVPLAMRCDAPASRRASEADAAGMVEVVVARHQQVDAPPAAVPQVRLDHQGARVAAAAERWAGVVDQHVVAGLDDRGETLTDVQHRETRRPGLGRRRPPAGRRRAASSKPATRPGAGNGASAATAPSARARPTPTARVPPRPRWPTTTRPARAISGHVVSISHATPRSDRRADVRARRAASAVATSTAGTISSV